MQAGDEKNLLKTDQPRCLQPEFYKVPFYLSKVQCKAPAESCEEFKILGGAAGFGQHLLRGARRRCNQSLSIHTGLQFVPDLHKQ